MNPVMKEEIVEIVEIIDTNIVVKENIAPTISEGTHQPSTSNS